MKEFEDKVAVITGAASGIGRGMAERCMAAGMKIALADIDEANLAAAETELKSAGGTVIAVKTDVSKRSDVERLARQTLDAFGQVHLLFNNAGVGAGGAPWEATWNDWEWVIGVNLWGVVNGVKVFTPLMLEQKTEGPHHQYFLGRRAHGGRRLRPLRRHQACGGGSLRKPLPRAATKERAREGIGSMPRTGADEYRRSRTQQAG